jgi:hypothetical protein
LKNETLKEMTLRHINGEYDSELLIGVEGDVLEFEVKPVEPKFKFKYEPPKEHVHIANVFIKRDELELLSDDDEY